MHKRLCLLYNDDKTITSLKTWLSKRRIIHSSIINKVSRKYYDCMEADVVLVLTEDKSDDVIKEICESFVIDKSVLCPAFSVERKFMCYNFMKLGLDHPPEVENLKEWLDERDIEYNLDYEMESIYNSDSVSLARSYYFVFKKQNDAVIFKLST